MCHALSEVSEVWVGAGCAEGGHEEDGSEAVASGPGVSSAVFQAGVSGMGRQSGEGGGLTSVEGSELGHEGDEATGDDGSDADNASQAGFAARQVWRAIHQLVDGAVELGD